MMHSRFCFSAIALAAFVNLISFGPNSSDAGRYDSAHLSITAQGLADAYNKNEFAADERFKDRQINIGGIVEKIGRDNQGNPYLTFHCVETNTGRIGVVTTSTPIKCVFDPKDEHALAQLQTGRTCTIYGTVTGRKNREVVIKDCSL
jgi:hypothetical protein